MKSFDVNNIQISPICLIRKKFDVTIAKRIKLIRKRKKQKGGENHWLGETRLSIIVFPIKRFEQWQSRWIPSRILFPSGPCVWTIGKQQEPAATSKGRSTSRHSTRGTYDNHVTHFLHDNVTVEFHYWRIDWGIAGAANLSVGETWTAAIKETMIHIVYTRDRVQINVQRCTFFTSIRHRRFLPYRFYDSHTSSLFNHSLFVVSVLSFCDQFSNRDPVGNIIIPWIYAWIFQR